MRKATAMGAIALMSAAMSACNNPSGTTGGGATASAGVGVGVGNAAALVGVWDCVSKSGGTVPDVSDKQSFAADGWFSSTKYPEGRKYKYRLDGDKLLVTFPTHEWSGKVTALSNDSLQYDGDATGESKVSCKKN